MDWPTHSLVSLAQMLVFDECIAMLDRGEGDVNERNEVRWALNTRTHHTAFPAPPHLCLRQGLVAFTPRPPRNPSIFKTQEQGC
jgi:hypothetical protein